MANNKLKRERWGFQDLAGQVFGRLTAVCLDENRLGRVHWICSCSCGRQTSVSALNLRQGNSQSCGCWRLELHTKHGSYESVEYMAWANMIERCENPRNPSFRNYGARGIKVCRRWRRSFEYFLMDMGFKPSPEHSLGRIDNDSGYKPSNCAWQTMIQQQNNKRVNRFLVYQDQRKTISEWAKDKKINVQTLSARIRLGWSIERALTEPVKRKNICV